jgi:hypothetical protein
MDEKWVSDFVKRGEDWSQLLEDILLGETSATKSDYYERFFQKSNPENADFLLRISYRLSDSLLKQCASKIDTKNYKEAHQLINKAGQYFSYYEEYFWKYAARYDTLEFFKI